MSLHSAVSRVIDQRGLSFVRCGDLLGVAPAEVSEVHAGYGDPRHVAQRLLSSIPDLTIGERTTLRQELVRFRPPHVNSSRQYWYLILGMAGQEVHPRITTAEPANDRLPDEVWSEVMFALLVLVTNLRAKHATAGMLKFDVVSLLHTLADMVPGACLHVIDDQLRVRLAEEFIAKNRLRRGAKNDVHWLQGCYLVESNSLVIPQRVLLDANNSGAEFHNKSRFSVAHECGHLVVHCLDRVLCTWLRTRIPTDSRMAERVANQFAAMLLCDPYAIAQEYRDRADRTRVIAYFSAVCAVSRPVVEYLLNDLEALGWVRGGHPPDVLWFDDVLSPFGEPVDQVRMTEWEQAALF